MRSYFSKRAQCWRGRTVPIRFRRRDVVRGLLDRTEACVGHGLIAYSYSQRRKPSRPKQRTGAVHSFSPHSLLSFGSGVVCASERSDASRGESTLGPWEAQRAELANAGSIGGLVQRPIGTEITRFQQVALRAVAETLHDEHSWMTGLGRFRGEVLQDPDVLSGRREPVCRGLRWRLVGSCCLRIGAGRRERW